MSNHIKKQILELLIQNLRFLQKDRYNSPDQKLVKFLKKNKIFELIESTLLPEKITQENLYSYLTGNTNNICDKCSEKLKFKNFKNGYDFCYMCIYKLKTKKEIYNYLQSNWARYYKRTFLIKQIINYDFIDYQELYDFLNDINNENTVCRLNSCYNKKRFRTFTSGYYDFCSLDCNNRWLSETRTGDANPIHKISNENKAKWKALLSKQVKERIKNGTWTPNITNSWCHSRIKIKFFQEGKEKIQNVRSSWEAFYQLMNPDYFYEKLRIPYEINGEWHNYIVDFIDSDNKIVIEIKPKSEELTTKNKIKRKALIKWCKDNNYEYKIINEDFFKQQSWDPDLIKEQPDKERLSKFKKYFLNEN